MEERPLPPLPANIPPLDEVEYAILDLESSWKPQRGKKSHAIATLGMNETQYYIRLSHLLTNPRAELEYPDLIRRLRRLRERRARERHSLFESEEHSS